MALFGSGKQGKAQGNIPTLVSKDCSIKGSLTASTIVRIDGNLTGGLVSEGLIIGEEGIITGNVKTKELIVYGTVNGDIDAEHVEIKASGKVCGEIITKALIVEDGGYYNGMIRMVNEEKKEMGLIADMSAY